MLQLWRLLVWPLQPSDWRHFIFISWRAHHTSHLLPLAPPHSSISLVQSLLVSLSAWVLLTRLVISFLLPLCHQTCFKALMFHVLGLTPLFSPYLALIGLSEFSCFQIWSMRNLVFSSWRTWPLSLQPTQQPISSQTSWDHMMALFIHQRLVTSSDEILFSGHEIKPTLAGGCGFGSLVSEIWRQILDAVHEFPLTFSSGVKESSVRLSWFSLFYSLFNFYFQTQEANSVTETFRDDWSVRWRFSSLWTTQHELLYSDRSSCLQSVSPFRSVLSQCR